MDVTIEDGVDGGVIGDNVLVGAAAEANNYGAGTWLRIGQSNDIRVLIKVDLSAYENFDVTYSKFSLYQYSGSGINVNWYRVLRSWGEGVGVGIPATTGESSYLHYTYPDLWTRAGCKGDGTDEDREATPQNSTPLSIPTEVDWVDFECLSESVMSDLGNEFSILIESPILTNNASYFRSSEYGSFKPTFYMEYSEISTGGIPRSRIINFGGI